MITLIGTILFFTVLLCIVWEIATTDNHDGAFYAIAVALFIVATSFFSLTHTA